MRTRVVPRNTCPPDAGGCIRARHPHSGHCAGAQGAGSRRFSMQRSTSAPNGADWLHGLGGGGRRADLSCLVPALPHTSPRPTWQLPPRPLPGNETAQELAHAPVQPGKAHARPPPVRRAEQLHELLTPVPSIDWASLVGDRGGPRGGTTRNGRLIGDPRRPPAPVVLVGATP